MMAAQKLRPQIVRALLYQNADPNICDAHCQSALFYSVKLNDLETAKILIEEKAEINY